MQSMNLLKSPFELASDLIGFGIQHEQPKHPSKLIEMAAQIGSSFAVQHWLK
jgi:hypothetical protein